MHLAWMDLLAIALITIASSGTAAVCVCRFMLTQMTTREKKLLGLLDRRYMPNDTIQLRFQSFDERLRRLEVLQES